MFCEALDLFWEEETSDNVAFETSSGPQLYVDFAKLEG